MNLEKLTKEEKINYLKQRMKEVQFINGSEYDKEYAQRMYKEYENELKKVESEK